MHTVMVNVWIYFGFIHMKMMKRSRIRKFQSL